MRGHCYDQGWGIGDPDLLPRRGEHVGLLDGSRDGVGPPYLDTSPTPVPPFLHEDRRHNPGRHTDIQQPKQRSALHDVVTREYTIHMHKRTHDLGFKKSASIPHEESRHGR